MNPHWQSVIAEIPWFLPRGEIAEVEASQPPGAFESVSPDFRRLFPQLEQLLREAYVTLIKLADRSYQLYSWSCRDGGTCGWLSLPPSSDPPPSLYAEHRVLMTSFGGIVERSNEPNWWLRNHNDALT